MRKIQINGQDLTLADVVQVAKGTATVEIAPEAWPGIRASRACVEQVVRSGRPVYGVNTGFGKLSEVTIAPEDAAQLQRNLIRSHACAVGPALPTATVRAIMLLRANALAKGFSGIRPDTLQLLVDCLNRGVHPVIPSQGSLGASGDLAPLAHLALLLMGEGEADVEGERMASSRALHRARLTPVVLQEKEGLALINGTQAMTAIGVLAWSRAERLCTIADGIAALTFEALQGVTDALSAAVHALRPQPGQVAAAASLSAWLSGSGLTTRQGELRVQDAYSLRCIPQVHGASRQCLTHVGDVLHTEINSATDNPLIFADTGEIISGGHFHGQPVALVMDYMKVGIAEMANISERRIERLVNPSLSGLPAFLARVPGLSSGLMILQYTAASLVSENKVLAHPASVDSIPSSAGQEDHVSMGTTAARQASAIVDNVARVLAIEAITAAEALSIQHVTAGMAPATRRFYELIREVVAEVLEDRSLSADIEALAEQLPEWAMEVCPTSARAATLVESSAGQ
ncbi:MAG: histidine ammonia-lyase [Firmicutes bacterium]|nr:histidine ammonia-lyase [Bacillota bacterium]